MARACESAEVRNTIEVDVDVVVLDEHRDASARSRMLRKRAAHQQRQSVAIHSSDKVSCVAELLVQMSELLW
jgi:hypothetical protein